MPSNPLRRYAHYGKGENWALVTGATNGMGEEFAHQLAGLGFNVIVHGRNETKLAAVKSSIESRHSGIQVRTIAIDASQFPPKVGEFKSLFEELKITVLINNVGIVSQNYPLLEEETEQEILAQLTTNNVFPTLLASLALPHLKQRQPSLMINMSSLGSWAPAPYLSPYSGAKAYNMYFSRALYNEMACEKEQVDIVCLAPGQVVSGMNEGPPTTMMPLAEKWVAKALSSVAPGFFSKRPAPVIVPWGPHAWGVKAMEWMTRSMCDNAVKNVTVDLRNKKRSSSKNTNITKGEEKTTTTTTNGAAQPKSDQTESEGTGTAAPSENTAADH